MSSNIRVVLGIFFCVFCFTFALTGCGRSAPTHYYTLSSYPQEQEAKTPGASTSCFSLGIGPVEFPAYLDRTHIITQGDKNQMHLADFDQWVEPLSDNFKRILMDNLTTSLCNKPVVIFPWPAGVHPDYQITIQVQHFDGFFGGEAVLRASWAILNPRGDVLIWKSSSLHEAVPGNDYAGIAEAQSKLVASLGQEIIMAIGTLRP
jgi:hypothetical protein